MMVGFVDVAVSRDAEIKLPWETSAVDEPAKEDDIDEFFKRFDTDQDGFVHREEVPTTFAVFAFWRFDENNDGMLDRAEASEITGR
jgi:Ca2+-binding EF-hand superfamily protein